MKGRNLTTIAMLFAMLLLTAAVAPVMAPPGPRSSELLVRYYADPTALFTGLQGAEIDAMFWDLTSAQRAQALASPNLLVNLWIALGMRQLDINNNLTLSGPAGTDWAGGTTTWNPTSDVYFRQAIAYLINKPKIITDITMGLGIRMDTPIPAILGEYINPAVTYPNYPWEYSPGAAAALLTAHGWTVGAGGIRVYPDYWEPAAKRGKPIDPLVVYSRSDDPMRLTVGDWLNAELNLIGIPTDYRPRDFSVCSVRVMDEINYHIYTGGWGLSRDPDYVHDLYGSEYAQPEGTNYPMVQCATFDAAADAILTATNKPDMIAATWAATADLVNHAHGVWLWTTKSGDSYAKGWLGVVNYAGGGLDNGWTVLNTFNPTATRFRVGLKSPPEAVNVITSSWTWDWQAMGFTYDSLISGNPYDLTADMPQMAKDWTIGTWDTGGGVLGSKITFDLRTDMKWHDGSAVTADDVKFTYDYIKSLPGVAWNYASVANYNKSIIVGNDIEVYFNFESALALRWAGGLPMVPKSVFYGMSNPKGYYPGGNEANMIGCSAFKWTGDDLQGVGGYTLLAAYTQYYWSPVLGEVDWRCSKGGLFNIDVFDLIKVAVAFGSKGYGSIDPAWNSAADLAAASGEIDIFDLIKVAISFGQTWGGGG